MPQLFDYTFADDMIRQAAEGLGTHDIIGAGVNQFQHFSGEEPAFSGLVAQGYDGFCVVC